MSPPLIHRFPFPALIAIPILLAITTIAVLFVHSDVNAALLWSQCHSHARIPGLSRIPALGTPLCYLISFFQAALDSARSAAVLGVILAFVGGLLTVSTVEAARICNAPNVLIAYPTGPWLVFNLVGGAVVWELVIIPAFLHRAKQVFFLKHRNEDDEGEEVDDMQHSSHLPDSEIIAIPVSIAIGFYLPSILMLVFNSAAAIGVWLFFPVYVSLVRQATRKVVAYLKNSDPSTIHLESSSRSLLYVYVLPFICSVVAQVIMLVNMAQPDDRKEMTRTTMAFIEIDAQFIALTVLYWMLVEVGWRVPLMTIATSVIVGPGAGTCLGWVYREKLIHAHPGSEVEEDGEANRLADEETPLLR